MAYNLLMNRVYWGYNPLTNLLLRSWDIQVECAEMGGFGYDTLENSDVTGSPKKGGHFKRKGVLQVLFFTGHVSFGGSKR